MRKRARATYLVLLAVGAIEDHMTRAPAGRGPQARGREMPARSPAPAIRLEPQGGITR